MTAAVWWTFGTTLGIVSPWLYWKFLRKPAAARRQVQAGPQENPYQAIEVRAGLMACEAASAMAGQRILSDRAPELPLPDCDQKNCHCRYVHLDDRRSGEERRLPFDKTMSFDLQAKIDKRSAKLDRRRGDRHAQPRSYFNDY